MDHDLRHPFHPLELLRRHGAIVPEEKEGPAFLLGKEPAINLQGENEQIISGKKRA